MKNYQSISLGYIDGRFINATLFVSIDHKGESVFEEYLTITDHARAMEALRRLERRAHRAASLATWECFSKGQRYEYTGKTLTFFQMDD